MKHPAYGGWYGVFYRSEDPSYRDSLMKVCVSRRDADKYVVEQIKQLDDGHESEWAKYIIKRVKISV